MRSAADFCSADKRKLSGGGSRMKVGVRQPSSTASARKCASIASAVGQSSCRSADISSKVMKASNTCVEEMIRRTCSDAISTAAISRSRSERSSESMMARRTSCSWWRGICSSSSCRITSITSAESKYSSTRSASLALNSSTLAGGLVWSLLDAVNVLLFRLAFTTSGGSGSGPLPFHSTTYLVPAACSSSAAARADGRSLSRPPRALLARNVASGTALAAGIVCRPL
mmetsp:Transcript_32562/g.75037  ORF Transcript_32562/g.75037 Transcript_32562/m.75037 type:complete len:228 (+) Transcript_32562:864-1547(+)